MKKIFLIFILLSINLLASFEFPNLTGHIIDEVSLLTSTQKNNIENILKVHENNTSNQIVVVIIKSLEENSIEEYSNELGRYWAIGQKDKNNGVLLVIAMQEHKIRIEVGYGLEGALTDKISHEIIEYTIKPKFKKKEYFDAINISLSKIIATINGEYKISKNDKDTKNYNYVGAIFGFVFLVIFLLEIFSNKKNKYTRNISSVMIQSVFAFIISSEILQLNIMLSAIISVVFFWIMFLMQLKNMDKKDIKESSFGNSTDIFSTGYGNIANNKFDNNGFSGAGGSFGGGGASGGW